MRVPKHPSRAATVHGILNRIAVRPLALRGEFLLAVHALPAGDLERGDDALADLEALDLGAHTVDPAAEFVP